MVNPRERLNRARTTRPNPQQATKSSSGYHSGADQSPSPISPNRPAMPQPSPASTPTNPIAQALNLAGKKLFGMGASSDSGLERRSQRSTRLRLPTLADLTPAELDAEEALPLGMFEDIVRKTETISGLDWCMTQDRGMVTALVVRDGDSREAKERPRDDEAQIQRSCLDQPRESAAQCRANLQAGIKWADIGQPTPLNQDSLQHYKDPTVRMSGIEFLLPEAYEARRDYCEKLIKDYHHSIAPLEQSAPGPWVPPSEGDSLPGTDTTPIKRIAVVGGGVAGLYTAMMLGVNHQVDVYEASHRVGGRLYTHKFKSGGKWDYFDVGAMRFPNTQLMKPTFELFDYLKLTKLVYKISQPQNWLAYNLKRYRKADVKTYQDDPFDVGTDRGGTVPVKDARKDPSELLYNAIGHFVKGLVTDREAGIKELLKYDRYSTRGYLMMECGLDASTVDYIETMSFGTGWFDRALAETVFEELCFQYDAKSPIELDWHCIEGGSEQIIHAMMDKLKTDYPNNVFVKTKHQVTSAVYDKSDPTSDQKLTVSGLEWTGEDPHTEPKPFEAQYSHVIFAVPPPCLRTIDLSTCELDYQQRNALRMASVGPSCKIGIKFKTAWWAEQGISGGQSTTDRLARTIVYPSYGSVDQRSTVLIASYSWTQDAVSLSALMQGPGTVAQERLKELMLADLAYVHGLSPEFLHEQFEEMYPWDWTHHPESMGAFGLFGPTQYQQFYCALSRPAAEGHVYFVGETISTIHGWVAGALESAQRGVRQLLELSPKPNQDRGRGGETEGEDEEPEEDLVKQFIERWHPNFVVSERLLIKQLQISKTLQFVEFNAVEVSA